MDMGNEMVSVIIPSYNRADCLPQSIESILRQTYSNLELIVVDDGSTDDTEQLFVSCKDKRIRYLRYTPNKGACYARNYGAQHACGRYIAFQDSDDIWHPEKLYKQMQWLVSHDAELVFCGMNRISTQGRKYYFPVHPFSDAGDAVEQLLMENRAGTQTLLMRREVWADIRFDESFRRYQDWDFILRAAESGKKLSYLPEALVDSPVTKSSISAGVSSVPALEHLYEAHKDEFNSRPACLARYYLRLARRYKESDQKTAAQYYRQCFAIEKRIGYLAASALCDVRSTLKISKRKAGEQR